jgi:hypothetical protein
MVYINFIVFVTHKVSFLGANAQRLRIDVVARANAEAQFNTPPHQTELN